MTVQTARAPFTVEWDDSVMFVFSFSFGTPDGGTTTFFCGFPHVVLSGAVVTGTQTQVSQILATIQQTQIQAALDPQTWIETVKSAARGTAPNMVVTFEDSISSLFTTQTGKNFTLQQLFSIAG